MDSPIRRYLHWTSLLPAGSGRHQAGRQCSAIRLPLAAAIRLWCWELEASNEAQHTSRCRPFTACRADGAAGRDGLMGSGCDVHRSEEHTSELQSLMRISYAVFCLKKKNKYTHIYSIIHVTTTY